MTTTTTTIMKRWNTSAALLRKGETLLALERNDPDVTDIWVDRRHIQQKKLIHRASVAIRNSTSFETSTNCTDD